MHIYLKLTDVITFTWDDMHHELVVPSFKDKDQALGWISVAGGKSTIDNYYEIVDAIHAWLPAKVLYNGRVKLIPVPGQTNSKAVNIYAVSVDGKYVGTASYFDTKFLSIVPDEGKISYKRNVKAEDVDSMIIIMLKSRGDISRKLELKTVHRSNAYSAYAVFLDATRVGTARYYKDGSVHLHSVGDKEYLGKCDNLCNTVAESVQNLLTKCN